MDVHINEAGTDDLARGVESAIRLRRGVRSEAEDVFAANPQIRHLVDALSRVDDAAIGDAKGNHSQLFYAFAAAGTAVTSLQCAEKSLTLFRAEDKVSLQRG
jgi:hypothetical protein